MKKEEYEHIKIEATNYTYNRYKHGGGKLIKRTDSEKEVFLNSSIRNIEKIIDNFQNIKKLMNYEDNTLIFSIKLKKDAYLDTIEKTLNKKDIDIIASYHDDDGKQIIVVNKTNLDKLKE